MTRLPPLFIDTGGWIRMMHEEPSPAWLDAAARREIGFGRPHTSDYVVLETYSFLLKNSRRREALGFVDVATSENVVLHASDGDLVDRAIAAARARPLKRELSLVDWTTVLLMREHGIRHIAATDRGFAQLGFELLP